MRKARLLKFLLLALAAILTMWLFLTTEDSFKPIDLAPPKEIIEDNISHDIRVKDISTTTVLIEPRFTGRDINSRQWDIRAKKAEQIGTLQNEKLNLFDVLAYLTDVKENTITVTAKKGIFDKNKDFIHLSENVILKNQGLILKTPNLTGNLIKGSATGGTPVIINADLNNVLLHLTSDIFEITKSGERILFKGNVKGRIQAP